MTKAVPDTVGVRAVSEIPDGELRDLASLLASRVPPSLNGTLARVTVDSKAQVMRTASDVVFVEAWLELKL